MLSGRLAALSMALLSTGHLLIAQALLQRLEPGVPIERSMQPHGRHSFTVTAEAGQFLHIRVEKKGVDVDVSVSTPADSRLLSASTPTSGAGLVDTSFLAPTTGDYGIVIASSGDLKLHGSFRITLLARRTPTAADSILIDAEDNLRAALELDSQPTAPIATNIELYAKAAGLFSQLNEPYWKALAIHREARVCASLRDYSKAIDLYNQALSIRRTIGDRSGEGTTLVNLASIYLDRGETETSVDLNNQALLRLFGSDDPDEQAIALMDLGTAHHRLGENAKALDYFNQALFVFRAVGDTESEAAVLVSIGSIYFAESDRNQSLRALDFFQQALVIYQTIKNPSHQAVVLRDVAGLYHRTGETAKSVDLYNQALLLYRSVGNRADEAAALMELGNVYWDAVGADENRKGADLYKQGLAIYRAVGNRAGEASGLRSLALIQRKIGERQEAIDNLNQALSLYRLLNDSSSEADALIDMGNVYCDFEGAVENRKAIGFYDQALAKVRAAKNRSSEAIVLKNFGLAYAKIGEKQKADDSYSEAALVYQAIGDRGGQAECLLASGNLYFNSTEPGERQRAIAFYNRALSLSRDANNRSGEAAALRNLAAMDRKAGQGDRAREEYDQALSLYRTAGDRLGEAGTLVEFGNLDYDAADSAENRNGAEHYRQALEIYRTTSNRAYEIRVLNAIGSIWRKIGEKQKSVDAYNEVLLLCRATKDRKGEADTLVNLGNVSFELSDLDAKQKTINFYQQALSLYHATGDQSGEGLALRDLGWTYRRTGDSPNARLSYNEAAVRYRNAKDRAGEAAALLDLGNVYYSDSDREENRKAIPVFQQALDLDIATGDRPAQGSLLRNLGLAYSKVGEKEKAVEFYNQALAVRRALGDRTGEAALLADIGQMHADTGGETEKRKAFDFFNQALSIERAAGNRQGIGEVLVDLGLLCDDPGAEHDHKKASAFLREAVAIFNAIGNRRAEAQTLTNIGVSLDDAQDERAAVDAYARAIVMWHELGDSIKERYVKGAMAFDFERLGDRAKAVEAFSQALGGSQLDPSNTRLLLDHLCALLEQAGPPSQTAACYARTVEIEKGQGDVRGQASTLVRLAELTADSDRASAAESYEAALRLYRNLDDRDGEIATLKALAKLEWEAGNHQKAYDHLRQTLGGVHALIIAITGSRNTDSIQTALQKLGAVVEVVSSESVTVQEISLRIAKISQSAKPGDVFLLFYEGDGAMSGSEYHLSVKKGGSPPSDGITATQLSSWINRLPVATALVFLDVPQSRGLDAFERKVSGVDDPLAELADRDILVVGPSANRPAADPDDLRKLVLDAFAQCLSPTADRDGDGFLSYPEIEEAFYSNLLSMQIDTGKRGSDLQRPVVYGNAGGDIIFATGAVPAESSIRGFQATSIADSTARKSDFAGKYYAELIATDEYDQWPRLSNPIYDATEIAAELHNRYGFETEVVRNPTKEQLSRTFGELKKKQFGPDDELLIFVAGHGIYDEIEQTGYLIAKDSLRDDDGHNTHISQQQIYNIVSGLKARHVILVIDACFGGAIAGLKRGDPKSDITYSVNAKMEAVKRKRNYRTRIFLTSGGKEYVPDGKPGAHSPFAFQLLRALKSKSPESNDSILTFVDLINFADQVQAGPQPQYGWFADSDPASDFWLLADPALRTPARTERIPVATQQ
jgi:tetratricopeptide (TPR) repeat protein